MSKRSSDSEIDWWDRFDRERLEIEQKRVKSEERAQVVRALLSLRALDCFRHGQHLTLPKDTSLYYTSCLALLGVDYDHNGKEFVECARRIEGKIMSDTVSPYTLDNFLGLFTDSTMFHRRVKQEQQQYCRICHNIDNYLLESMKYPL